MLYPVRNKTYHWGEIQQLSLKSLPIFQVLVNDTWQTVNIDHLNAKDKELAFKDSVWQFMYNQDRINPLFHCVFGFKFQVFNDDKGFDVYPCDYVPHRIEKDLIPILQDARYSFDDIKTICSKDKSIFSIRLENDLYPIEDYHLTADESKMVFGQTTWVYHYTYTLDGERYHVFTDPEHFEFEPITAKGETYIFPKWYIPDGVLKNMYHVLPTTTIDWILEQYHDRLLVFNKETFKMHAAGIFMVICYNDLVATRFGTDCEYQNFLYAYDAYPLNDTEAINTIKRAILQEYTGNEPKFKYIGHHENFSKYPNQIVSNADSWEVRFDTLKDFMMIVNSLKLIVSDKSELLSENRSFH